jgi:hypothetical protein
VADVDDLIARAKPRQTTVPICLAGDLNARHQDLSRQLEALAGEGWQPESLSAKNPRIELAEQIQAVEQEMAGQLHTFVFGALPPAKFAELKRAHPARADAVPPERLFNTDTFPAALVAACCQDPVFPTVAKVDELFERLGQGAFDAAFDGAWSACTGGSDVPKSLLASATIRSTGPK